VRSLPQEGDRTFYENFFTHTELYARYLVILGRIKKTNMDDLQHVGYSKEVIEFVAVAKEFCTYIENTSQASPKELLSKLQKFIPLLYLKGSLLPNCECEELGLAEESVTEEQYNTLYNTLRRLLGEHDEYLEVFDDNMQYRETPVVNSISEKICDIYQDLKNFISAYRHGMTDVIEEALWQLNYNFESYWGKACANVLRAIHVAVFRVAENEDEV